MPRPSVRLLSLLLLLVGATAVPAVAGQLPGEQLARQRIRDLERAAAAGDTQRVQTLAFEISSDYRARRLLKTPEFEDIGRLYFDSWFEQGDGLIHDVIRRAKGRLAGRYPDEILELIKVVQRDQSRLLKKAPMDFDIGILTQTRDQAVDILHRLGGPGAVSEFHARLQEALEEAYVELYRGLGGTGAVRPKRAFITATTAWHPEAFADARVLQTTGVAGRDLVQQTADVSKYKVNEMRQLAAEGELALEEAMEEAARGTVKDLDQVDRVFERIRRITGVAPELTGEQRQVRQVLADLAELRIEPLAANQRILQITGGRQNLFASCDNLIDTMEAAWKLRTVKPQEMFLALMVDRLDDVEFGRAYGALLDGNIDELPASARRFAAEVETLGKARLIGLSEASPERFLAQLAEEFPSFRISAAVNEQPLRELIRTIGEGASADDLADVFGKEVAEQMELIRSRMTPEVKSKIRGRFLRNNLALLEVDKNGWVLLGDAGSTLKIDAAVGIAMGFVMTATIMDQQLSPDEEYRQLLTAWGTALPIVGDVAQGLIELGEYAQTGETDRVFKAGAWLVVGAAGFVPGAQMPALIAGLGMAGYEATGAAVDANRDRELLQAWIDSGVWDRESGTLEELLDAAGVGHLPSFEGVILDGDTYYQSGLTNWSLSSVPSRNVTMRNSIYLWTERNALGRLESLQSYLRPLREVYPEFPFEATLREPRNTARSLFAAAILEGGGDPPRSLERILFQHAKEIVDGEARAALRAITAQAELEYQARYHVGATLAAFRELEELGRKLGLPLVDNVNTIFAGFESYVWESLRTPWVRDSLPRRKVMLAEKYLQGYREIDASLASIRSMFERVSIQPPRFNLSGFLEVDAARVRDLEAAYANVALGEAARQVQRVHREVNGQATYVLNRSRPAPCDEELFRQLAGIGVRLVEAEDRRLLLEAWAGRASAAAASRDAALRRAQASTAEISRNIVAYAPRITDWSLVWEETEIPELTRWKADMEDLDRTHESAYAWANVRLEGTQVYEEAIETQESRLRSLRQEHARVLEAAPAAMARCLVQALRGSVLVSKVAPEAGDELVARVVITDGDVPPGASWSWVGTGGLLVTSSADVMSTLVAESDGTLTASLALGGQQLRQFDVAIKVRQRGEPDPDAMDDDDPDLAANTAAVPPKPPQPGQPGGTGDDAAVAAAVPVADAATDTRGWSFSGTASANWKGGNHARGLHLKRDGVKTGAGSAACDWEAQLGAELWANLDPTFSFSSAGPGVPTGEALAQARRQQIRERLEEEIVEHKRWHREAVIRPVSLGDFSGFMLDTAPAYAGGGWSDGGYRSGSAGAFGHGYVLLGTRLIELQYNATGSGCFDNSHERYLMAQARAAQQEAQGILGSLRLVPDGSIVSTPYTAPPAAAETLSVTLAALPERPSFLGETVEIRADVRGGVPPYTYTWSGDHAGQGQRVSFASRTAGAHRLGVTVTDAEGNEATSQVTVTVNAVTVRITRSPAGAVHLGDDVGFQAVIDGGAQANGLVLLWQPHPEVAFSPFERALSTSARFPTVGSYKVWAEAFSESSGQRTLVGESEQLELEVLPPELSLVAEPAEPLVGEEVRVSLRAGAGLPAEIVDFWWEVQGGTRGAGPLRDNREYTFLPTSTSAVVVTAHGKALEDGADLGEASITVRARPYQVTIPEPTLPGPPPRRWDPAAGGLVEVPRAIAVDRQFGLTATVSPTPLDTSLRFEWRVTPEGLVLFSPGGRSTTAQAGRKGEYTVSVEVTDSSGVRLGAASRSVAVTIASEDAAPPPGAPGPAAGAGPDLDPISDLISAGRTEEAAQALAGLPAEDAVAAEPLIRRLIEACQAKAEAALARRDYDAALAQFEAMELVRPGISEATVGRIRVTSYRTTEADIARFLAAARSMLDAGRYWDAEDNVRSAERFDAILPRPASPQVAAIVERYDAVRGEYARFVEPLRRSWSAAWDREDWDGCLEIFRQLEVRPLNPEDAGWVAIMRPELERMRRAEAAAATPTTPLPDAFTGVFGQWDVRLNGQPFVLEIGGTPGSMIGALSADGRVEPLDAVSFDAATSTLRFARPIGGGLWQLYTGSLAGRHLEGFFETGVLAAGFAQGGHRYSWNGEWLGGLDGPPLGDAAAGSTAPQDQQGVFGQWDVRLNGQPFLLEIGGTPGNMTGALSADGHVEPLDAVSFDAATSTLRFARPIGGGVWQLYSGVLDGGRLAGFFETGALSGGFEQGTYQWTWSGERPQR